MGNQSERSDYMEHEDLEAQLESLVDQTSLLSVLETLTDICHGKAEHLRSNWQDNTAAKAWEKDAHTLDNILGKTQN
jgi:hypothetical protein